MFSLGTMGSKYTSILHILLTTLPLHKKKKKVYACIQSSLTHTIKPQGHKQYVSDHTEQPLILCLLTD